MYSLSFTPWTQSGRYVSQTDWFPSSYMRWVNFDRHDAITLPRRGLCFSCGNHWTAQCSITSPIIIKVNNWNISNVAINYVLKDRRRVWLDISFELAAGCLRFKYRSRRFKSLNGIINLYHCKLRHPTQIPLQLSKLIQWFTVSVKGINIQVFPTSLAFVFLDSSIITT